MSTARLSFVHDPSHNKLACSSAQRPKGSRTEERLWSFDDANVIEGMKRVGSTVIGGCGLTRGVFPYCSELRLKRTGSIELCCTF